MKARALLPLRWVELLLCLAALSGCGGNSRVQSDPADSAVTASPASGIGSSPSHRIGVAAGSSNSAIATTASTAMPVVYRQPAYESPVRANPDDLLLIPGQWLSSQDTIIYQAVADTNQIPSFGGVPNQNTSASGILDVVSVANVPLSITVHLPAVMTADQTYALWVRSPSGSISDPVLINDARPMWISPDFTYQTATIASLPRVLKVIGRNLEPGPGATTLVRMTGLTSGAVYTLTARNATDDTQSTVALERYVAAVPLPGSMTPDRYSVQVSRDGVSWVLLLGDGQSPAQYFVVKPDPAPAPTFAVASYTDPSTQRKCIASDPRQADATACILLAIQDAVSHGGGTVLFGPGTWYMSNPGRWAEGVPFSNRVPNDACTGSPQNCEVTLDGVLLPPGVNLQGAGATGSNATRIVRGPNSEWSRNSSSGAVGLPSFTLVGNNSVTGIDFTDQNTYTPTSLLAAPVLQLGAIWYQSQLYTNDPPIVTNVIISDNVFDKPWQAIANGQLPMEHIYVTSNTFGGAFGGYAIYFGWDSNEALNLSRQKPYPLYTYQPYHFTDSVISGNTFYPSGRNDGRGPIASQIVSSRRVDFSNNTANGSVTATGYLYSPSDPTGWRAAYFWSTGTNQEMMLVSGNTIICPGDKSGGGEAIAYDGTQSLGGLATAEPVTSGSPWTDPSGIGGTTLNIRGPIVTMLATTPTTDITARVSDYYRGFWLQVVKGAGIGQWRKIVSASLSADGQVALNVTPAFDVTPDTSSLIMIANAYWQNTTVNNTVDQRAAVNGVRQCTKGSTSGGGSMTWFASTADSVMEGNQQYDTNGIYLRHGYLPTANSQTTPASVAIQSSNDVRYNLVDGNYNSTTPEGSQGGIQLGYGAAIGPCSIGNSCQGTCTSNCPEPPLLGFGISLAWNSINQAYTLQINNSGPNSYTSLGAIGLGPDWSVGPVDATGSARWDLGDSTLAFHNSVTNVSNSLASVQEPQGVGLSIDDAIAESNKAAAINWHTVTYANGCSAVDVPMSDLGISGVHYCPTGQSGGCECRTTSPVDVSVSLSSEAQSVATGAVAPVQVTVKNNSSSVNATGVVLELRPSAGTVVAEDSLQTTQGICDPAVNLCILGALAPGATAQLELSVAFPTPGTWPLTFTVNSQDADPVESNNSITLVGTVGN